MESTSIQLDNGKILRLRLSVLGCIFVATGISGLLAEQIFEKLLSTVVGASVPASAIVLSVYFLGLTLGALSYGRLVRRSRRPLLLYGVLEACAGAWGLVLWIGFSPLQAGSARLVQLAGESEPGVFVLRLLVSGLWILPPTFAMGMTFPAVVGALRQLRVGRTRPLMARFYALNLFGAVLGTLIGPYFVFPRFGLSSTLLGTAALGFLILATTVILSAGLPRLESDAEELRETQHVLPFIRSLVHHDGGPALLGIAFASGFLVFGFEVIWIHLIASVLGNSVYAFAIMLATTLGGLFVGGLVSSLIWRRDAAVPTWNLVFSLVVAAWLLAVSFGLWDQVPAFLGRWGADLSTFAEGQLLRFVIAAGLIGVPATAMGVVFPLSFRLPWFPVQQADRVASVLAAVNAVGCILGALGVGFVLLPTFGSEATYRMLTVAVTLLGVVLGVFGHRRARSSGSPVAARASLAGTAMCLIAGALVIGVGAWDRLALTSGINVYFRQAHVGPDSSLLFFHEDTRGGFTTVVENPAGGGGTTRVLLTNGKFQGNDSGEMSAQIAFSLIPIVHQPRRGSALVIGLGTGHSAHVVAASGYESIHLAEISPGIVEAARTWFARLNGGVLDLANARTHLEDGRNYLLRTDTSFDLVTMEITSIWFAGSCNLYSQDFYELVGSRLPTDGVFQQWIQFHHISPVEVVSVIATICSAFDHVTVWFMGGQAVLVASQSPLTVDQALVQELSARPQLAGSLRVLELQEGLALADIGERRLLDAAATRRVAEFARSEGIPINTDRNRFLEYATPRYNLEKRDRVPEVIRLLTQVGSP